MARTTAVHRKSAPWLRGGAPVAFLLLWSGGFAFVGMGLRHAPPLSFLALRFALVVAVLVPLLALLRPALPSTRAEWAHLAVVGVLLQALYFGLAYLAMERISPGTTALVVSLQPVLVGLIAPRLTGEVVGARRWTGLGLGLLGAAIVILARGRVEATSASGLAFAASALVAITAGTLLERRFGTEHHPVSANLVQYAVALAVTLPVALAIEDLHIEWTAELWISLAYLVIGNSLISITLLLAMLRRGEASRVSALFFLVPPIAALIAWALLGEEMPAPAWAGLALAGLGVAIATRSGSPRAPEAQPLAGRIPR
jgi:drug/metabolite transporter (DMT)-like permease